MVFERNRYLESLWVCRKQQLSHGWKESKNCVLRMIVRTFGTWTRAVVSLKYSPSKGVVKKGKKTKRGKKSKQSVTVAFFVSADGEKVGKSIWKNLEKQKPSMFS